MRPRGIIIFERLFVFSVLAWVPEVILDWRNITANTRLSAESILILDGLVALAFLSIVLRVSRKRGKVSKWILTLVMLYGIPLDIWQTFQHTLKMSDAFSLLQTVLQAIGVSMLFTPASRAWLSASRKGRMVYTAEGFCRPR